MRGLFIGTESYTWKMADFTTAAQRVKPFGIDTLFVKVADGTDLWYGGYTGIAGVLSAVTSEGITAVPYIFSYANTYGGFAGEVAIVNTLIGMGYQVCMDMESAWNGASTSANSLVSLLNAPIYISTWADPHLQNWDALILTLAQKCIAFLPQDYTAFLDGVWQAEFAADHVSANQLIPTFNGTTLQSALKAASFVLWEYGSITDSFLQQFTPQPTGGSMSLVTNAQGCVLDIVQSFQLENGETQDACGPWSVSSLRVAGLPGKGARGVAEDVDSWADTQMNLYMPNGQVNWPGTSIAQMYQFLSNSLDPVSKQRNLHWWDIAPLDTGRITAAVKAGYPVLITANEQNIIEKKTGKVPYPWSLNANHILPIVGIDAQGDFICADELNNNYQGYWPPVYLASRLAPSWATVIQVVGPDPTHPWLAPIPGADPLSWPKGFNAQLFAAPPVSTALTPNANDLGVWNLLQTLLGQAFPQLPPLPTIPCDPTHAIPQSWLVGRWKHSYNFGTPLELEQDMTAIYKTPYTVMEQEFTHARASWHSDTGKVTWYDGRGVIIVL